MKKHITVVMICCVLVALVVGTAACGNQDLNTFYTTLSDSQQKLDVLADTIYNNWYGAIYKDEFLGNIDYAISAAFSKYETQVTELSIENLRIEELYSQLSNHKEKEKIENAMNAYIEYYDFVVNVSGSFQTFSAKKEQLKKAFSTAMLKLGLVADKVESTEQGEAV